MQQQYYPQLSPTRYRVIPLIRIIIGGLAGFSFGFIVSLIIGGCVVATCNLTPPYSSDFGNIFAAFIVIIIVVFAILSAFSSRYCLFCIVSAFCAVISFIIPYFIGKLIDQGYTTALAYIAALIFFPLLIFITYFFWKLLRVYYFKDLEKPEKTILEPTTSAAVGEIKRFGQRTNDYEPRKKLFALSVADTPAGGCCMRCGNNINHGDMFCQKCGTKIGGGQWE